MEYKETKETARENLTNLTNMTDMIVKTEGLPEIIRGKGDNDSAKELETARCKARRLLEKDYSEEEFKNLCPGYIETMDSFAKEYNYDFRKINNC